MRGRPLNIPFTLILVSALALAWPADSLAETKTVVVSSVTGKGGGSGAVIKLNRALGKLPDVKVLSPRIFWKEATRRGLQDLVPLDGEAVSSIAVALKINAVIFGDITRKGSSRSKRHVATFQVISGGTGLVVGRGEVSLARPRLSTKGARTAAQLLAPFLQHTRHTATPARPTALSVPAEVVAAPRTKASIFTATIRRHIRPISGAAGLAFLLVGIAVFLLRRPSKAEAQAVYWLSSRVRQEAAEARKELVRLQRDGGLAARERETHRQIDRVVNDHLRGVDQRVAQEVDGAFFGSALKALAPNNTWKREFQQRASQSSAQILRGNELEQSCAQVLQNLEHGLITAVNKGQRVTAPDPGLAGNIARLRQRQQRWGRFMGSDPMLEQASRTRADTIRGVGVGGAAVLVGGGILFHEGIREALVEALGTDIAAQVAGAIAGQLAHSELIAKLAEFLYEWIIEEVGEEILEEVVEAAAVALTGLGAVFTAYKAIKYGMLIKRLAIDKEPLVKMQKQVRETSALQVRSAGEAAKQSATLCVQVTYRTLENSLKQLEAAAAERQDWSRSRMGALPA